MSFRNKYLKYKEKYLNLKNLIGGAEGAGGGAAEPVQAAPEPRISYKQITPDYLDYLIKDKNPGGFLQINLIGEFNIKKFVKTFNSEHNGFNASIINNKRVKFSRTIPHIDLNTLMNLYVLLTEHERSVFTELISKDLKSKNPNITEAKLRRNIEMRLYDDYIVNILDKFKTGEYRDVREIDYQVVTGYLPSEVNTSMKYNISKFNDRPIDYETLKGYVDRFNETAPDIIGHVEEDTTKVKFIRTVAKVDFVNINDDFIEDLFNIYGKSIDDDIRLNIETINGVKVAGNLDAARINELNMRLNTFSGSLTQFGKVKFTFKFIDEVDWSRISDGYLNKCIRASYDNCCRLNISTNSRIAINNEGLRVLVATFNSRSRQFSGSVLDNNRVKFTMKLLEIDWNQITEEFLNFNLPALYTEIRVNISRYTKPDRTVEVLNNKSLVELVSTFNESQTKYSASVTNGTKVKFSPRLINIDFKDVYATLSQIIQREGDMYRMSITEYNEQPIDSSELHKLIYMNNLRYGPIIGQKLYGDNKYIFRFKPQASNITKEEIQQTITKIGSLKDFVRLSPDERESQVAINNEIQKVFDKLNNLEVYRFSKNYNTKNFTDKQGRDKMITKLTELLQNLDISATGNNTASTGNNTATASNTAAAGNTAAVGYNDNLDW